MSDYYVAITYMTVSALVILIVMMTKNKIFDKRTRNGFILCNALTIVASLSEFFGLLVNGTDLSFRFFHVFMKFIELSYAPAIPVVYAMTVMPVKNKWAAHAFVGTHMFLEFLSAKYGFIFYVDDNNIFHQGKCFWIYYITFIIANFFLVYRLGKCCFRYQSRNKLCPILIMLFLIIGSHVRMFVSGMNIMWMTVAIGSILFCAYYGDLIQQVDFITELLNRRSYENNVKLLKSKAYIIYFDADDFKRINDEFGHINGDDCLKTIGKILKESYGKYGLCYRTGGDEFCVIADRNIRRIGSANEKFCKKIEKEVSVNPAMTTVSMGYVLYNPNGMDLEHALKTADKNMYENKRAKKVGRENHNV